MLAAQETLVLQALGGSQNLRIELLRPDRLADIGQRVPNGGKEGRSGVLQRMPPVGDLHRVWQGPRHGAAVPAVPIAGDDLDLGCRLSQASTVAGSRSGRRSMTRRRSRSQINVP